MKTIIKMAGKKPACFAVLKINQKKGISFELLRSADAFYF